MKLPRRNFLHLVAGAAALPAASRLGWAQVYALDGRIYRRPGRFRRGVAMRVFHHEPGGGTWRAGPSNWKCLNLRSRQGSPVPSAGILFGCITQHSSAVADRNRIDRDGGIMLTIRMIVAVTALVITIAQSRAQNWPTRPVTIVYPFAAGSAGDVLGRIFASRLSELLGQPVL